MGRRGAPLHVNQFVGGLNTETNPLTNPLETSKDELNMDLNKDGSRSKRLGFDLEDNFVEIDTTVPYQSEQLTATTYFKWNNAGGDPDKSLLVVQVASSLTIFDLDVSPITNGKIYSKVYAASTYGTKFSYATLGELLVVVTGEREISVFEYDGGVVTLTNQHLHIRDLFGVEGKEGSTTLTESQNIEVRPSSLEETHTYNLRNQTFAIPRRRGNNETIEDTIESFYLDSGSTKFPSNADSVNPFLYPDANDADNRLVERYFSKNAFESPTGNTPAPKGYFIIDAMDRGASRLRRIAELHDKYSTLSYLVTNLPIDVTVGGPSVVDTYAGRFWFGGFSSTTLNGDANSPDLSSYIFFSRIVKNKVDITECYQAADPTSNIDSAIADDDGGFIKLDQAYKINRMVNILGTLFVFAENGVWKVTGPKNEIFSATGYSVDKLTDEGCISSGSVVVVDDTIYYWGEQAIFRIRRNEFGLWLVEDVSKDSIQTKFRGIDIEQKKVCSGYFDNFDRTIRWVYNTSSKPAGISEELRLYIDYEAYVPYRVNAISGNLPRLVSVAESQPYTASSQQFPLTINGEVVTENGATMTIGVDFRSTQVFETIYIVLTNLSTTIRFSIGKYDDGSFYDWKYSSNNYNYDAYLITHDLSFGDPRAQKVLPYVYTFLKRTETGFDALLNPVNPSSCMLSARWGWSDHTNSGKWTTPRQAYRYKKTYFPVDASDTFETGFELITTRNSIRGRGPAVSLKFESEGGKNMYLYGWSFYIEAKVDK